MTFGIYQDILYRDFERKKKKREQLRKRILADVKAVLEKMHNKIPFKDAYIFGSVIKSSDFKEESDIDIAFLGLPEERLFESAAYLAENY